MRGTRSRVRSYAELGLRGGDGTAMAPVVRRHQKLRYASTLSISSIGMLQTNVKSLGEIISAFSPQNELPFLLLTRKRNPAGFEPASATWTECYVPITPRALIASIRMTLNAGKGASHTSGKPVPNWEAAHRSIGQQALAPTLMTKIDDYPPVSRRTGRWIQSPVLEVQDVELLVRSVRLSSGRPIITLGIFSRVSASSGNDPS